MPRAFIAPCWGSSPTDLWYPWLATELTKLGYAVTIFDFPDKAAPKVEPMIATVAAAVGNVLPGDIFIGHSIGCQTIARFLTRQLNVASTVLFVGPWQQVQGLLPEAFPIAAPWVTPPFRFDYTASRSLDWQVLLSDNDPYVDAAFHAPRFAEWLGANVTVVKNRGHFENPKTDTTLPEALLLLNGSGLEGRDTPIADSLPN